MFEVSKVLAYIEEALHDYAKANHGGTMLDSINASGDTTTTKSQTDTQGRICDEFAEKGAY